MKPRDKDLGIPWPRDHEITLKNFPTYRPSVNRYDKSKISRLYDDGLDTFQIAHTVRIHHEGVKMALPKKMGKPRNNA